MRVRLLYAFSFMFGFCASGFADSLNWRASPLPAPVPESDKSRIGHIVCGEEGYVADNTGLRCKICPEFTENRDSDEGLEIDSMIQGSFTSTESPGEWILDTQGCEAHFESFGGAMLLAPAEPKPPTEQPASAAPDPDSTTTPSPNALAMVYYEPGYRLNDCLPFGGEHTRTLLVCNEYDVAQGEVVGHISAMEISKREITRWRLLRWYDNTGTDLEDVLSVVPTTMQPVQLDAGEVGLQIEMQILETSRELYDKAPDLPGRKVNLVFRRQGQRFFATEKTQAYLKEIGDLTRKMLE